MVAWMSFFEADLIAGYHLILTLHFSFHNAVGRLTVCHASLVWRHNGRDGVSNHQPHDYLLNRSFRRGSKKTWKLRVTGLCVGNSPVTGEFPVQIASNAENVSIWWHHHVTTHPCKHQFVGHVSHGDSYVCMEGVNWPSKALVSEA